MNVNTALIMARAQLNYVKTAFCAISRLSRRFDVHVFDQNKSQCLIYEVEVGIALHTLEHVM